MPLRGNRSLGRIRLFIALLLLGGLLAGCQQKSSELTIGGGPEGGTFQGFAEALAGAVQRQDARFKFRVVASAGSVANLVGLNRGDLDLALVYAGDAYLGRRGRLQEVQPAAKNVRALCRLYSAAAQLVVPRNSPRQTPTDLAGARVAIGNPGSGTALAAERYFKSCGLWNRLVPIHVGFDMAFEELARGRVDAVWLLVGYPNRSLAAHAKRHPLRLLDLFGDTEAERRLFSEYPFYTPVTIPAGTYVGQERAVASFGDSTLLLARSNLGDEQVYQLLQVLFADKTRQDLAAHHQLGKELQPGRAQEGVKIPLHTGAYRFWRLRGTAAGSQ